MLLQFCIKCKTQIQKSKYLPNLRDNHYRYHYHYSYSQEINITALQCCYSSLLRQNVCQNVCLVKVQRWTPISQLNVTNQTSQCNFLSLLNENICLIVLVHNLEDKHYNAVTIQHNSLLNQNVCLVEMVLNLLSLQLWMC